MRQRFTKCIVACAVACSGLLPTWAPADVSGGVSTLSQHRSHAGGIVIPPFARPYGYSLAKMAALTAAFNVSNRLDAPPGTPFQILYQNSVNNSTFNVQRGTVLYVPVVYNDDSLPVIGDFPQTLTDRRSVLTYWYSQREFGVVAAEMIVDGKTSPLGPGYVAGAAFNVPLPDGATHYLTVAAFLTPLTPGTHQVGFHFRATGDALSRPPIDQYFPFGVFEFTDFYTVNVN